MNRLRGAAFVFMAAAVGTLNATERFVSTFGADTNDGLSRATALRTVQKGVDALIPGDTLTIGPGEYHEAVKRDALGSPARETLIRAEIPGTVVLRGDVPVSASFRLCDGSRFVYVADFSATTDVVVVNELDTLKILNRMPNAAELEFNPGTFFHDPVAGKLYLSSPDLTPAEAHRYSASLIATHGLYLTQAKRVTIEGLAVTGFNAVKELHYRSGTLGGVWGMFLFNGKQCVIRDCRAYLNGWGIGLNSAEATSGDNVIERCVAWANTSPYWAGDMGGLTIFSGRRDTIRDSTAFLNGMYGINIYGTGTDGGSYGDSNVPGNEETNKSRLVNNLAWDNRCDFKIKTGVTYHHTAERCIGLGHWSISRSNIVHALIGGESPAVRDDTIVLHQEKAVDMDAEFADPAHHDFRLQATSRFRGSAGRNPDRGPFPYEKTVFYVKTMGDDAADGLSVSHAWKTLARAVKTLRPGDTLYLEPGVYPADLEIAAQGRAGQPVSIRGRGNKPVVIRGAIQLSRSRQVTLERLTFTDKVTVTNSGDIAFNNCQLQSRTVGLRADKVDGLRVTHCTFTGCEEAGVGIGPRVDPASWADQVNEALLRAHNATRASTCSRVYLSGNLYDNRTNAALRVDAAGAIEYSDYNSYRIAANAWDVAGKRIDPRVATLADDRHSQELAPEFSLVQGVAVLANPERFAARGPLGKVVGVCDEARLREETLRLAAKPMVHSVSATTANLEWMTSLPAACELAWGETPACENKDTFEVNCFGTYSLTGLKPGHTYYFRLLSLSVPVGMAEALDAKPVTLSGEPVRFTTLNRDAAPVTYTVAPDGKDTNTGLGRSNAWQTIRHAAEKVQVGDTVLIAGGTYRERVRVRATGESNAPITFTCVPGEKVIMDGAAKALNRAFVVTGKSHLRFDGMYFIDFNMSPGDGWDLRRGGEFQLYRGRDIEITRCLWDGRGGYTAESVHALFVDDLRVRNCVSINKMGGAMYFWRCPDLKVENTVFFAPMINSFIHRNTATQKANMNNNIFTDMLEKKAKQNIGLLCVDGWIDAFRMDNNCFLLRCFPPETRALISDRPIGKLDRYIRNPVFADPQFAGDPVVSGLSTNRAGFPPDRMMDTSFKIDFNSFFATNPELVKRGIGLQPAAFRDFKFAPLKGQ